MLGLPGGQRFAAGKPGQLKSHLRRRASPGFAVSSAGSRRRGQCCQHPPQAFPLAIIISQGGDAPYGGSLADLLSQQSATTCDTVPRKIMSYQMPRRAHQSGEKSSRTFICYQGRLTLGKVGSIQMTHTYLNPNWPPRPTDLQGGREPSGFFTVSLEVSTGTAAQGWDALQNENGACGEAPVQNGRICSQGDGSAGKKHLLPKPGSPSSTPRCPYKKPDEEAGASAMAVFPLLCLQPRFRPFLNMGFLFRVQDMLSPKLSGYQPKESGEGF